MTLFALLPLTLRWEIIVTMLAQVFSKQHERERERGQRTQSRAFPIWPIWRACLQERSVFSFTFLAMVRACVLKVSGNRERHFQLSASSIMERRLSDGKPAALNESSGKGKREKGFLFFPPCVAFGREGQ